MEQVLSSILQVLKLSERLKCELRHSWLSSGRQESVAEHTWQMAFMALLVYRHLEHAVDIERALKMVIVHDLVEAEAGDVPFFETGLLQETKRVREQLAIERLRGMLDTGTGEEIYELWQEFEARQTREARFVKALDDLEVQVQHNHAALATWEEVEYALVYTKMNQHCGDDAFLQALSEAVRREAEEKWQQAGLDVEALQKGSAINES